MKSLPTDEYYMSLALAEALKARGRTSPNPMVGAVLVRGGKILAKAHHRRAGLPHAEIEALNQVKDPRGATLYVTLEPCCHLNKRTPPCAQRLAKSGIRRLVIGTLDPNPAVSGRGARLMKKAKISTTVGCLAEDCLAINRFYNHWVRKKAPYVILKSGVSLDGRIALGNGRSKWITGRAARHKVHEIRSEADAILVGIRTVLEDDPRLTARLPGKNQQPAKIVLDPHFKIPLTSRLLTGPRSSPVYIFVSPKSFKDSKARALERKGAGVAVLPVDSKGRFRLQQLLLQLGRWEITVLLVEGGGETWMQFYQSGNFQEWWIFLAPKLLGSDARPLVGKLGLKKLPGRNPLRLADAQLLGEDLSLRFLPS